MTMGDALGLLVIFVGLPLVLFAGAVALQWAAHKWPRED